MFWNNLLELCSKSNISPNKLCSELGYSNATSTKWKKGAIPQSRTIRRIAEYFNVSEDYLLTEHKPIHNPKKRAYAEFSPTTHIVAFIDALGTANNPDNFPILYKLYDEIYPYLKLNTVNSFIKSNGFIRYIAFSDNILLAFELSNKVDVKSAVKELTNIIGIYQANVLKKHKILLRGAITVGDLFIDETINFVGGTALSESVKSEKDADTPRIIIDDTIVKLLNEDIDHFNLFQDIDGTYFINYLKFWEFRAVLQPENKLIEYKLKDHIDIINAKLSAEDSVKIRKKLNWVKIYHSRFVTEKKKNASADVIAAEQSSKSPVQNEKPRNT